MEHPDYFAEPFTRMGAWIDMLLLANYKSNSITVRHQVVPLQRGQIRMSEDALAARWQWSRGKVRRFLKKLEENGQIVQQKNNVIGCITIVNYKMYQSVGTTDGREGGFGRGYSQGYCGGGTTDGTTEKAKMGQQEVARTVQQNVGVTDCFSDEKYGCLVVAGTTRDSVGGTTEVEVKSMETVHKQKQDNKSHTQSNTYQVTDKTRARAREMLDWVARRFPEVAAMPKPFTEEQAVWLVRRYSEEDIMRIVADMDNKQATRNTSAYATFCSFAARDTVLKERREAQEKLYSYEEVCTAVSGGLRFDDFEITAVRRNGQNLWRRK